MNDFFAIMDFTGKAKPRLFAMIVRGDKPADGIEEFIDAQKEKFDTSMLDRIAAEFPDSVRGLRAFTGHGQREGVNDFVKFNEVDISGWKQAHNGHDQAAKHNELPAVKRAAPAAP